MIKTQCMKFSKRTNEKDYKENRFINYLLLCYSLYFYVTGAADSIPFCLASFIQWSQF